MVHILDGNSEIGAISIISSDICLNREESPIGSFLLHACATCSELPTNYNYHAHTVTEAGLPVEFQASPPSREYNTAKLKLSPH